MLSSLLSTMLSSVLSSLLSTLLSRCFGRICQGFGSILTMAYMIRTCDKTSLNCQGFGSILAGRNATHFVQATCGMLVSSCQNQAATVHKGMCS